MQQETTYLAQEEVAEKHARTDSSETGMNIEGGGEVMKSQSHQDLRRGT